MVLTGVVAWKGGYASQSHYFVIGRQDNECFRPLSVHFYADSNLINEENWCFRTENNRYFLCPPVVRPEEREIELSPDMVLGEGFGRAQGWTLKKAFAVMAIGGKDRLEVDDLILAVLFE